MIRVSSFMLLQFCFFGNRSCSLKTCRENRAIGSQSRIDVSGSAWWMAAGIAGSLGVLGYFKYADFFVNGFAKLVGCDKAS